MGYCYQPRRNHTLWDIVCCWHELWHAVAYKTTSRNLSVYIFQGNRPDFPNKRCWVEGHTGIGEKSQGVGNVNSQSSWVMPAGPCSIPQWPFCKWTPAWLTQHSHLHTLPALPPLGAAESLQWQPPSFSSFLTAIWYLALGFFQLLCITSLSFPWVKVEFSIMWCKTAPFQKEANFAFLL